MPAGGDPVRQKCGERDPLVLMGDDAGRCSTWAARRGRPVGRIERHAELILGLVARKSDITLAELRAGQSNNGWSKVWVRTNFLNTVSAPLAPPRASRSFEPRSARRARTTNS